MATPQQRRRYGWCAIVFGLGFLGYWSVTAIPRFGLVEDTARVWSEPACRNNGDGTEDCFAIVRHVTAERFVAEGHPADDFREVSVPSHVGQGDDVAVLLDPQTGAILARGTRGSAALALVFAAVVGLGVAAAGVAMVRQSARTRSLTGSSADVPRD